MKFLYVMFFKLATQSGLLLLLFLISFINCTDSRSGSENLTTIQLEFLVFTPNELLIKINKFPEESFNFITLRLGVKRSNQDLEDLEYGDNYLKNGNFYINDSRLQLKTGDIINYLIAYRNSDGYHAKTGKFIFDGVYRKRRSRRSISNIITIDETVNESAITRIPRAGFNPWTVFKPNSFESGPHGPPPFSGGGGGGGPPFGGPPPFSGFPPFDPHHHHHHHHHHGNGGGPPFGHNHYQFCNGSEEDDDDEDQSTTSRMSTTKTTTTTTPATTTTTTEYYPDIDIRFGN